MCAAVASASVFLSSRATYIHKGTCARRPSSGDFSFVLTFVCVPLHKVFFVLCCGLFVHWYLLYCTVLYCTVLYCTVPVRLVPSDLPCLALPCIVARSPYPNTS
ncbi:hypothetical protein IWX91DRAFT_338291 [Phyllosticta citricarpa]